MVSLARIFLQKENKKHLEKKNEYHSNHSLFFFFAEFFSRQIFIVRDIALDVLFLVCHRIFETSGFGKKRLASLGVFWRRFPAFPGRRLLAGKRSEHSERKRDRKTTGRNNFTLREVRACAVRASSFGSGYALHLIRNTGRRSGCRLQTSLWRGPLRRRYATRAVV